MLVRLRTYDREVVGTAQAPLARIPLRTFRHDGMLYERISDGADNLPEYRATERTPETAPQTADVMNAAGCLIGTVTIPAMGLLEKVLYQDMACQLYTRRDQHGRAVYLQPDRVRLVRDTKGRFRRG